jgi:hypothetical protein
MNFEIDKFILYSGGAIGTDTLFGTNAERFGITEQHYSFRGHANCRDRGRVILDEAQLKSADEDLSAVIGQLFKKHQGTGDNTEKYWQRNWFQVQKAKEVFVVTKGIRTLLDFTGDKIEGAAIAVALAIKTIGACRRVCAYDQTLAQWFVWKRNSEQTGIEVCYRKIEAGTLKETEEKFQFAEARDEEVKIVEADFAGIGVGEINDKGQNAVEALFKRSFLSA